MALGELLGEAHGKVAGLRVLENGRIEVSLQGAGKILGSDIMDVTTFSSEMMPNGTAQGEGQSLQMGADLMAEWRGTGVGRPTGPGSWKYSYGGMYKKVSSPKFARLLECYVVGEYSSDADGNYTWKLWEWKY